MAMYRDEKAALPCVRRLIDSGANVNAADAMVNMIELSRHFDLQVKAMRTAEENAAAAAQLLKG